MALVLWQAGLAGTRIGEAPHPRPGSAMTDGVSTPLPPSQDRDLIDLVDTGGGHQLPWSPRPQALRNRSSTPSSSGPPCQPTCLWSSGHPSILRPPQPHLLSLSALPRRPPPLLSRTHFPPLQPLSRPRSAIPTPAFFARSLFVLIIPTPPMVGDLQLHATSHRRASGRPADG